MHLVSVQVGRPRTVGVAGAKDPLERRFTSAIWKRPVTGPVWAGTLGLEGDAVANTRVHGGPDQALLMYAESHYRLWRRDWGRDDVGPGDFGENLTVAGLTEEAAWSVRRAARAMLARNERLAEAAALARCGALSEAWRERLARS